MTAAALLLAGCAGEDLGTGEDFSIAGALQQVPLEAIEEWAYLSTGDIEAALLAAELDRGEDVTDWYLPLTSGERTPTETFAPVILVPPEILVEQSIQAASGDGEQDLGFTLQDVEAYVSVSGRDRFAVVTGDFDRNTLPESLLDGPGDLRSLGEGDDFTADAESANSVSRIGLPVRLAQRGDSIAISHGTAPAAAWLDEQTGGIPGGLMDLAEAFDERDAASAVLANARTLGTGDGAPERSPGIEEPFDFVAVAWGGTRQEPQAWISYAFLDEAAAGRAVEQIERTYADARLNSGAPLRDVLEVQEITAQGPVVTVAVLPVGPPANLAQLLWQAEPIVAST